jgi:predicted TIM-barrel fold metal-dependent hydrolase
MIIDAHIHLLPKQVQQDRQPFCGSDPAFGSIYANPKARIASEEDIISYLDSSEIDKAIVFGFPWEDPDLVARNNDEVWSFSERHPGRIFPFAVLSSAGGDKAHNEALRTLEAGFAGIGELAVYDGGWSLANFEALSPSLDAARTRNVPVLIHVNEPVGHEYPGKIAVDFSGLLRIIETYQDLDFILAHFGGGIFVYGLMPEVAGLFSRTYLDTAACPFLYDPRIFDVASTIMGPDKVIFGSDYPLLPLSRYLKEFDKAGLDAPLRDGILGENIARILDRKHASR